MTMKQFFFIDLAIITVALLTLTGCEHDDVLEKEQAGGIPDGVEAVDLGLSVKWASKDAAIIMLGVKQKPNPGIPGKTTA